MAPVVTRLDCPGKAGAVGAARPRERLLDVEGSTGPPFGRRSFSAGGPFVGPVAVFVVKVLELHKKQKNIKVFKKSRLNRQSRMQRLMSRSTGLIIRPGSVRKQCNRRYESENG